MEPGRLRVKTSSREPVVGMRNSSMSMYVAMAKLPHNSTAMTHSTRAAVRCSFHAIHTQAVRKAK